MPRSFQRRRLALQLGFALVAGIGLAFAIDVLRSGGLELWLTARGLGPPYEAKGRLIPIADGRSLYLDCRGAGSPTVILDNGLGSGADGWGFVLPKLSERTRVCAYDRPGTGRSSPRATHTVGAMVDELRAALRAAGETGPYLVVGHSLGGVYARVFAARARTETVGVVLVDAYFPDQTWADDTGANPTWLAELREQLDGTNEYVERAENVRWAESRSELDDSRLDGIPLEVLAVDQHLRYDDQRIPPDMEERIISAWRDWCLSLSPGMTQITIADRSGHVIQYDRPDVVIAAVERLLNATGAAAAPRPPSSGAIRTGAGRRIAAAA